MRKKDNPLIEGKLITAGGGGGFRGSGPAANVNRPMYEIWMKPIGREPAKKVGTAASAKSANRVIDRRDSAYGAAAHYKKPVGRPRGK